MRTMDRVSDKHRKETKQTQFLLRCSLESAGKDTRPEIQPTEIQTDGDELLKL